MGRTARGVTGMRFKIPGDCLVSMEVIRENVGDEAVAETDADDEVAAIADDEMIKVRIRTAKITFFMIQTPPIKMKIFGARANLFQGNLLRCVFSALECLSAPRTRYICHSLSPVPKNFAIFSNSLFVGTVYPLSIREYLSHEIPRILHICL
ncbi:hypothetical protein SDC9_129756 [bioreactor metagenome]|uniref:Uncharacterized protein n=1 Tax=bioreactor metagenome TaxID=1076179 RepID=A0A645D0F8_9ZZZZ